MYTFTLEGSQYEEVREGFNTLLGLSTAQTFITVVLLLVIIGLLVAGIVVSRWYK